MIGLVEVLWKVVASLLNCRITAAISFHDTIHGFWAGRGKGTAALKAKLLQKLKFMMEAVLFEILWISGRPTTPYTRKRPYTFSQRTVSFLGRFDFFGRTGTA